MGLVKHFESVWNSKGLMLTFYTLCYFSYVALGGLIFLVIEGAQERTSYNNIVRAKHGLIKKYPCLTEESIDEFLSDVLPRTGRGALLVSNFTAVPTWSYSQSVFFSVTLITTIGYGHVAPVSQVGKAVCMIYTAIGIPFTFMLVAAYVQRFLAGSRQISKCLFRCFGSVLKPLTVRIIHQSIITLFIITAFFVVPAVIFFHIEEGWTYLDCLYFCFISLTTVGLGDYVPGEKPFQPQQAIYRFCVTGYVLLGVVSMMFLTAQTADFQYSVRADKCKDPEKIPIIRDIESYGAVIVSENPTLAMEKTSVLNPKNDMDTVQVSVSAVMHDL